MFPRIREIIDAPGTRLRVSVDAHPTGALILLEYPDRPDSPRIMLNPYGTELLLGYIMSARIASASGIPDETVEGGFASRFRLIQEPQPMILINQGDDGEAFEIPARFWDKVYAELCMTVAHTRELLRRRNVMRMH